MKQKGFTLIELLTVISIIGLLSSVILASLSTARSKAALTAVEQFDASIRHSLGDQLVGEWLFDSANPLTDTSGFNNTGSISGGVSTTTGYNTKTAMTFDGSTGYINIPYNSSLNITGDLTISAWVYPTVTCPSVYCGILVGRGAGVPEQYELSAAAGGIEFAYNNGSIWYSHATNSPLPLNTWTEIAVVHDTTTNTIAYYKNGALIEKFAAIGPAGSFSNPVRIGVDIGNTAYFTGSIDDVRLYSSSLLQSGIEKIYAEGRASHPDLALKQ